VAVKTVVVYSHSTRQQFKYQTCSLTERVKVLHPNKIDDFRGVQGRSSQPISWLSAEKLNLTQQKQTCICNERRLQQKIDTKNKTQV